MTDFSLQEFEDSSRENGPRYWDAQEFMGRLGYETWQGGLAVITRAMGSCTRLGIDPTEVFIPCELSRDGKSTKSYKLTRFACFLICMHGDQKKPEVMKMRAVLAAVVDQLIKERIETEDLSRIETREDLKLAERLMSGIAQGAGLEQQYFGIFKDAGFRGMYNMGLRDLMNYKGVPGKSIMYDFMGLEELAGNLFRVTQTAARINGHGIRGLQSLSHTAKQVGSEVRQIMTKDGGTPPEELLTEEPIANVKKRLKTAAREMKKLDAMRGRKKLPPG